MKVSELTGEQLAYWVAKAQGWVEEVIDQTVAWVDHKTDEILYSNWRGDDYRPDKDGKQAKKVALWGIEKWGNHTMFMTTLGFAAEDESTDTHNIDDDMAEPVCRSVVFLTYGEEVPNDQ